MALVSKTSSSRVPIGPEQALKDAIQDFQSILSDDQRTSLQKIKTIPDADAVITFTAQLDYSNRSRKGRSIASRLHSVLQSVREFSTIVDTFVSSHPDIAALVWGSIKLTMLLMNALWQSFYQEFKPDADDIQRCGDEVKEELALAKAQADHQDQVLQNKERDAASGLRSKLRAFMSVTKDEIDTVKQLQLQRHLRDSVGSGKTILTAGVIEHVFASKGNADECVTFFFVRYDDPPSLKAETILRSIIRQSLDPVKLSEEMVAALRELDRKLCPSVEDLVTLLRRRIALSNSFRVFIDGLDECEFSANAPRFLWVTYLIDELCTQCCDDDIRKSLRNLPEDLKETFNRALSRIVSRRTAPIVQRIFPWVAAAKQNLTLNELREAISTEIGQPFSKPEKLVNGIERIVAWCENLLQVDEERQTVQFAHGTIYDFITGECSKPQLANFHVDLEGADHHAGEICVTYLHFNDFKATLARRPQPIRPLVPTEIAQTALGRHGRIAQSRLRFMGFNSNHHSSDIKVDIIGALASYKKADVNETLSKLQLSHDFLSCGGLSKLERSQMMTQSAAGGDVELISILLDGENSTYSIDESFQAASEGGHLEVIERLLAAGAHINAEPAKDGGRTAFQAASAGGHLEVVKRLLAVGADVNAAVVCNKRWTALQAAAEGGHLDVIEQLLSAGANVNAKPGFPPGRTALQAASGGGHLEVVERLLAAGANINARPTDTGGRTALQAASGDGHLEVAEQLLAAGANINAEPAEEKGRTALQAASEGGHLEVVERLLAAGADINAEPAKYGGLTALQAASGGGHLEVVKRLLAAKANVNAKPEKEKGRTALQAASKGGHLEVVKRLLAAGAKVNAEPAEYEGQTALQAASGGGHLEVVKRLLAAGADINAEPAFEGQTALQTASGGGHLEVVERLLATGADINAEPAKYGGLTALQAASGGGHLEVVERLKRAGAV
ncbi:hypothetical protein DL767_008572 [Monosporascus sp. MG133]|nr:hypothetical protein DL767_008572 [Monosporascus sp. MG133]